jgi:hypothetical protein
MKTISKLMGGAVAAAALAGGFAAPAAAQYYPGSGGVGNVVVGQVLDSILRGGLGGGYGYQAPYGNNGQYGYNQQSERYLIDQCARATEQRLNSQGGYGGNFRVVQVDRLERTRKGNLRVYGTAAGGGYQGNYGGYYGGQSYGYGNYANNGAGQYRFNCKVDYRGRIADLRVDRGQNGYNNNGYRY